MITTATTERNTRLIPETIITSHTVTSVRSGVATVPWPSRQTLKIKNILTVFGSVYCQYSAVYTKMFNFRRITLFLEKRLSKHKMTIFSTSLGGGMTPLALPCLRLCFGPPLGNSLRTPLHTVMAYHVEHHAQSTPPHHGLNLLISVE